MLDLFSLVRLDHLYIFLGNPIAPGAPVVVPLNSLLAVVLRLPSGSDIRSVTLQTSRVQTDAAMSDRLLVDF